MFRLNSAFQNSLPVISFNSGVIFNLFNEMANICFNSYSKFIRRLQRNVFHISSQQELFWKRAFPCTSNKTAAWEGTLQELNWRRVRLFRLLYLKRELNYLVASPRVCVKRKEGRKGNSISGNVSEYWGVSECIPGGLSSSRRRPSLYCVLTLQYKL